MGLVLASSLGMPCKAWADETEKLLRRIHALNQAVIKAASLAKQHAGRNDVRSYGRLLEMDHRYADYQVLKLAKDEQLALTPPASDDSEETKRQQQLNDGIAELEALRGAEFDLAFLRTMRSAHTTSIDMLSSAQRYADPHLLKLLDRMIPILEQHVELAVHLAGSTEQAEAER